MARGMAVVLVVSVRMVVERMEVRLFGRSLLLAPAGRGGLEDVRAKWIVWVVIGHVMMLRLFNGRIHKEHNATTELRVRLPTSLNSKHLLYSPHTICALDLTRID